jgi:hypothetical protein
MRNKLLAAAIGLMLLLAAPLPARALETQPGDACTTADQHQLTGGPENPGTGYHLVCDGSVWKAIVTWDSSTARSLFQVNNDAGSCTATKLGRIRYDGTSTWEYCNGTSWANIASSATPGGANTNIQFNSGGAFGASANFNWDNANSRLGIGMTSPLSTLTIGPNVSTGWFGLSVSGSTANGGTIGLQNTSSSGYSGVNMYDSGGTLAASFQFGNSGSALPNTFFFGNRETGPTQIVAGASATPLVTILNGGNVGIGTTTPLAALDVRSAVTAASAVAYGLRQQQILTAAANNDALYGLYLNTTYTNGAFTGVTNTDIGFNGTGAAPAPRVIAVDRNATAATAGFGLTLNAGGAVSGGTNLAGGDVTINGGVGTGSGTSNIIFTASPGTAASTADNTLAQVLKITGKGTTILAAATDACAPGIAGGIRYTSAATVQFCNGTSWANISSGGGGTPAGSTEQIQFNSGGVFGASANFNWDNANSRLGIMQATPGSALDVKGTLRLSGATSGYVGLAPAAAAGSITYTLPTADGVAGQVLKTNGSATLSWIDNGTLGSTGAGWIAATPIATSETRNATTYADLTTVGPAVTITTGTTALVTLTAKMSNATPLDGCKMGFAVSGATTVAAGDTQAVWETNGATTGNIAYQHSGTFYVTGLNAGSNIFTAKYSTHTGGTCTFLNRDIVVTNPVPMQCSSATPVAFSFTNQANVAVSTLTTSNIVQLTGFNCSLVTSITGPGSPAYRICNDSGCSTVLQDWTPGTSSIVSGQYMQLRLTSSASGGVTNNATVIAGGTASVWGVATVGSCGSSPAVGTLCADGSIYAGISPNISQAMYVTHCDAGMTWDGTACNGTRFTLNWNNGTSNWIDEGFENSVAGMANTAGLAAKADAASPHYAAQACKNLNEDGHTDWYLLALSELNVIYSGRVAIGNFDTSGAYYWASTENGGTSAMEERFSDGGQSYDNKNNLRQLRCARAACSSITPNAFSFTAQTNVALSTLTASNIVQLSGFDCAANTSISGAGAPAYRTCSDSACATVVQNWTTGAGSALSGQYVQTRMTSSATAGTPSSATLTAGSSSTAFSVTTAANCSGSPAVGTVCPDGSVYAGVSPGRGEPMYATHCDSGMAWSGTACTGGRATSDWNNGTSNWINEGRGDSTDGYTNTAVLAALTDADSPHYAAQACKNLNEDGYTDWYLPAQSEMNVLYSGKAAIGNFDTTGNWYWSSTENGGTPAMSTRFNDNAWAGNTKSNSYYARCVRVTCNDTTPNAFSFTDQGGVALSTLIASNIVQLIGFDCAASTSISGAGSPAYRTCSDPACSSVVQNWTTGAATVAGGQYVQLRLTSSATGATINSATLTAGGGNTTWNVETVVDCTTGTPPVGTVCADGSIYAGVSPGRGEPMYATRCDSGQTWSGTACTGGRATPNWNNGTSNWIDEGRGDSADGYSNTAVLAAKADAASPHYAAQYCKNLNQNGHTDWYLPAQSEMNVLYSGKAAIGNFDTAGGNWYWSSTENGPNNALETRFNDNTWTNYQKYNGYYVRCTRVTCNDTTPDGFSFTDQGGVALSTLTTTNIVQLSGFDCAASTSISGAGSPAYRTCSDPACSSVVQNWTTGAATVAGGQFVQLRLTSSASAGTINSATLTAGGGNTTWNVETVVNCTTGTPPVGTVCSDGSIYAGVSPNVGANMFVTRCDSGMTWSGTACTGTRLTFNWNNGTSNWIDEGYENSVAGMANTTGLAALADAASPHYAAQRCKNLNEDGHTDWYLPALSELNVMYAGKAAIGNFDTSGTLYWPSTESTSNYAWYERFSDGWQSQTGKNNNSIILRCARATCNSITPNAFSFTAQTGVAVSTLTASNIVLLTGFDCAVNTSISGAGSPAYRICSDSGCSSVVQTWTTGSATAVSGQYVQTRLTSSATAGTLETATLTAGNSNAPFNVTTAANCTGSPPVGTPCADGSLYAGISPDGSVPMYATRCDAGMTWSGTACTGGRSSLSWNNGTGNWIDEGQENPVTGRTNTTNLAALADAASPHYSAQACKNLNEDGHTDWYLPSLNELNVLYGGAAAIGNFSTGGAWYWSSSEVNNYSAWMEQFSGGGQQGYNKNSYENIRCTRR